MPTRDWQERTNLVSTLREIKVFGFWGEYGRKTELKGIDGRAPQGVELAA